jgi:serine/threonine protein kinase
MDPLVKRLTAALQGTYAIERELGGGGMSRVFVAREVALDRQVVVKVLPADLMAGVNVERFRREIQLAARLQQANILPVLTAGEVDGIPYFTMPYVEGESLRDRLRAHGPLPIPEVLNLLRDVARALGAAHEHGIVHRDIKPENVLVSHGTAVVADFGIAKAISAAPRPPAPPLPRLAPRSARRPTSRPSRRPATPEPTTAPTSTPSAAWRTSSSAGAPPSATARRSNSSSRTSPRRPRRSPSVAPTRRSRSRRW